MVWIILLILLGISVFVIVNIFKKLEKLEDISTNQKEFINKFSETIAYCSIKLNQIDNLGAFKSDDEIGWFFEEVKEMQELLNQYNQVNNDVDE